MAQLGLTWFWAQKVGLKIKISSNQIGTDHYLPISFFRFRISLQKKWKPGDYYNTFNIILNFTFNHFLNSQFSFKVRESIKKNSFHMFNRLLLMGTKYDYKTAVSKVPSFLLVL